MCVCVCVCVCPRARLTSVNNIHCVPVLCVSLCYGVSCIYLFLTPNSRSAFRAGVSLNIHSFIHSFTMLCNEGNVLSNDEHNTFHLSDIR